VIASTPRRLLIAETDPVTRRLLGHRLNRQGFDVVELAEPWSVADKVSVESPDLVLLEISANEGFEVLERLRPLTPAAVIGMLSPGLNGDEVTALDRGADDCVSRPIRSHELDARIHAVLRRTTAAGRRLSYDDLDIDLPARTVRLRGRTVDLTAREFDLLAFLASHPNEVFSRDQLLTTVWRSSPEWQQRDTVTEHVHRLRARLEDKPARPRWILTARGAGYRFVP